VITITWRQALLWSAILMTGLVVGFVLRLPPDQALNVVFALLGMALGLVGIQLTLWVSAKDRELKIENLSQKVDEVHRSIHALETLATQMWKPVMAGITQSSRQTAASQGPGIDVRTLQLSVEQVSERDRVIRELQQQVAGSAQDYRLLHENATKVISDLVQQSTFWQFRFFDFYLLFYTKWVLKWFAKQTPPGTFVLYELVWGAYIANPLERASVVSTLNNHGLLASSGAGYVVTTLGRDYLAYVEQITGGPGTLPDEPPPPPGVMPSESGAV
jgi:hypothetical protein